MEHIMYERPRERLRLRGAHSLSTTELVQVVLGSGSSKVSGAKLAKQVVPIIERGAATYDSLRTISGMGDAKTCQLLAVAELSKRLSNPPTAKVVDADDTRFAVLKTLTRESLIFITYTGDGKVIATHRRVLRSQEHHSLVARRIFAQALSDGAASLDVGIGWRSQILEPSLQELSLIKSLEEIAVLMQIAIQSVLLINKNGSISLRERE